MTSTSSRSFIITGACILGAAVNCTGTIEGDAGSLPQSPGLTGGVAGQAVAGPISGAAGFGTAGETAAGAGGLSSQGGGSSTTAGTGGEVQVGGTSGLAGSAGSPGMAEPPQPSKDGPAARNLQLTRVEANQGVAVALLEQAELVAVEDRNAELIYGRPMLVRVHWEIGDGWSTRDIRAVLRLKYDDETEQVLDATRSISTDSDADELDGTINWLLDADAVRPGMEFSVALLEAGVPTGPEPVVAPRVPAELDATTPLGVTSDPMVLKLVVVPALTSSGAPEVTPEAIEQLHNHLFDLYPVQAVEIDVRDPVEVDFPDGDFSSSDGFSALREVCEQDPEREVNAHYSLILNRGDLGVSYSGVASGRISDNRSCRGINLVFVRPRQGVASIAGNVDTSAHELGHNHGRRHVDCGGPNNPDPNFPYEDGDLGVQGFSLTKGELRNRDEHKELMSYCRPRWVSDWQYRAFTEAVRDSSSWVESAESKRGTRPAGLSLVGYLEPDTQGRWLIVPGNRTEPSEKVSPTRFATITGQRYPVSIDTSSEGDTLEVSVGLPGGLTTGKVEIVVDGLHRTVDLGSVKRL